MSKRLKVLLSAYACEPGKGSEPEVGWQWAMQMARFHDVTVLTRENNRQNIEAALAVMPKDRMAPQFIYFDGDPFLLKLKKRFKATRLYYIWWQRTVRKLIDGLCQEQHFDLLHHVTIAGYRYITAIWGHGVPCIWGPVGGMESIDWRLMPFSHPREFIAELGRNLNNLVQSMPTAAFPARAKRSQLTIASTRETRECLASWDIPCVLMPTIGLELSEIPQRKSYAVLETRPLRLLFVGQLIWLKGADLAVEALAASGTDATLHFIGGGPLRPALERLAVKLGVSTRVTFSPRIPRAEVLSSLPDYDVFLFPSLHDSGGFAVIEAMASGMPVICLDTGGPAISVVDGCGFRVPINKRRQVVAMLADNIIYYNRNREEVEAHGKSARRQITENYLWDRKGEQMHVLYLATASKTINPSSL